MTLNRLHSFIRNSSFAHKMVANSGTELILNLHLEPENWLLISELYCIFIYEYVGYSVVNISSVLNNLCLGCIAEYSNSSASTVSGESKVKIYAL